MPDGIGSSTGLVLEYGALVRSALDRSHTEDGSCRSRTSQKHNAHWPEIVKVHYRFHPLYGQSLVVQRRVKFPHGEYIFCELPDGTIGGFPSWIADAAKSSDVTVGTPLASAAALVELCALLGRLHSDLKRDKASLKRMRQERTNANKGNAIDDADEPAVL